MRNKNLLLALTTLSLKACSIQQKPVVHVHDKYLACYALNPAAKQECLNSLAFEAEKLGFKQFINNLNLPCAGIENGPEFIEEKKAYLILCSPNHQYFMQFNYDTFEWKLIEEKNNDRQKTSY
jgi:hypothetical protein